MDSYLDFGYYTVTTKYVFFYLYVLLAGEHASPISQNWIIN